MDTLLEKIYKAIIEIGKSRYLDQIEICNYMINTDYLEGSFEKYHDITSWSEYLTGNLWGTKDQYCWFKTKVTIPESFANNKVIFSISTGHSEGWDISNPQFLIYVNDILRQGLDVNHKNTLLSNNAKCGEVFNIVMLGYSGLNETPVTLNSSIKTLDPVIEDYYYNLSNLFWSLTLLDSHDFKRPDLIKTLLESIDTLDLRKIHSDNFYESIKKANSIIVKKYYSEVNCQSPVVTAIGHTHIDIAWMWTIEQTKEKVVRSFSTVLELMKVFPEYYFMSSQPQLYQYIKDAVPELYSKIKERVIEGRWEVDGGMWLEADCNIPSGESLSRHFLYGTRFIQEEFDQQPTTLWLPDVFGYTASLPQLIKKSGLSYMMTSKLDWNQFNRIPHDTFLWKGIDGSEVLTHLITTTNDVNYEKDIYPGTNLLKQTTYNGRLNANQVKGTWTRYQDTLFSDETLQLFGFGDGGGGPTEEMLENYKRLKYGLPGIPRVVMDKQKHFFQRLEEKVKNNNHLKKWQGELYLEFHQGTYTSVAKNKKNNRKAEFLAQEAEAISLIGTFFGYKYPKKQLHDHWKKILLYQFHDIIPGTSISSVYEETDQGYRQLEEEAKLLLETAFLKITAGLSLPENAIIVFNMSSNDKTDIVSLSNVDNKYVHDSDGNNYPLYYSSSSENYYFLAKDVPCKGFKVYYLKDTILNQEEPINNGLDNRLHVTKSNTKGSTEGKISNYKNRSYYLQFNDAMELISIFDISADREMLKHNGRGNVLQVFEDNPREFDNWNIDITYKDKIYEINNVDKVQFESNPLFDCIEIMRPYQDSYIKQKIVLYHHHSRIDFKTEVNWHEKHILLKTAFEVDINAAEATYDIQYGNITRPTHENTSWDLGMYEVCGHRWADLSESGYGVSLMNDCKYGYDIKDSCMRLTLIKSGTFPHEEADQGLHEFTYSIYSHKNSWRDAETVELAYNLNVPFITYITPGLEGLKKQSGFNSMSFISFSLKHVQIDTVKMSEDDNSTIIRLYEFKNMRGNGILETFYPIKAVFLCDLLENNIRQLEHKKNSFNLSIKGYEILTIRIVFLE